MKIKDKIFSRYKLSYLAVLLFVLFLFFMGINFRSFSAGHVPEIQESETKPGGDGTVSYTPFASFMKPAANLKESEKPIFYAGKALAHQPWVKAPTITSDRDGLGPLFNARSCLRCHINGGRGFMPNKSGERINTAFLRLSIPGFDKVHGVVPEPTYGDQLQTQSTSLAHMLSHLKSSNLKHTVAPEAYVTINWQYIDFHYPDGSKVQLRKPQVKLTNLGYGELHPQTMMSLRNPPPLLGVGLLDLIKQEDINRLADENDKDGDGISGRVNIVWDFEKNKPVPGRFGLKANKASVRLQTAAALHSDMGLSNPIFPSQPCTKKQISCNNEITGNDSEGTEVSKKQLELFVYFTKNLAVPERRNHDKESVIAGRRLFYEIGCAACHYPSFKTGYDEDYPHLSNQVIWPYTDLLLHDMGKGLADGRPDYLASGSEWRTPPLWGIGLSKQVNGAQNFLHDGRARTVEEAILWHGGEAEQVKQRFIRLDKKEREKLIEFVNSL